MTQCKDAFRKEARAAAAPVVNWLLEQRARAIRSTLLFDGFCRQLRELTVPLDRTTLHIAELHPQLRGRSVMWDITAGGAVEVDREHGIEASEGYLNSPVHHINLGGEEIRRDLSQELSADDYPIFHELKAKGYEDYRAFGFVFSNRQTNTFTVATKHLGGFSDRDLAILDEAVPAFAAILELRHAKRTARQLLDTYVGHRTGEQVLSGAIKRGDGERIEAVLWVTDLRSFTSLSETQPLEDVIGLLDDYFGIMGRAIAAHSGEILKFMGDSVLAIFPIGAVGEEQACREALAAGVEALDAFSEFIRTRQDSGLPVTKCGIAIHLGEVLYGNIGTEDRLDFTVIGPAVNLASRMESVTRDLDPPLVFSARFAGLCSRPVKSLGKMNFKGIAQPQEVFTLASESHIK